MGQNPSLAHILGRVGVVEERIRALVALRRADDPQPDDPFRGLYLSEEAVDRLLEGAQSSLEDGSDGSFSLL
jgi:hypothetical protein